MQLLSEIYLLISIRLCFLLANYAEMFFLAVLKGCICSHKTDLQNYHKEDVYPAALLNWNLIFHWLKTP